METRIIKDGKSWGKQVYALVDEKNRKLKYSIDKERLEKFQEMLDNGEKIPTKEHHETYKDYARVVKCGYWNGNQRYALRHNAKNIEFSIHKDKLQKKADELNKEE